MRVVELTESAELNSLAISIAAWSSFCVISTYVVLSMKMIQL